MASGILHDFRQPITAIYGYMDLLAMTEMEPEKREEYRDKVVIQVDNMLGMVNELLDFARGEVKLQVAKVRVIDFIREIVDAFEVQCKSRYITLESSVEWTGSIEADRNRMRRVLENLIRNSIQAVQQNGMIEVNVNKL
ncbi:sensor histidine kinase, partial [Calditrichota bacterium]